MNRALLCSLIALAVLPAAAYAAAKPGSYNGVSSASINPEYGSVARPTDKGKVTFTVRSGKVSSFRLKGQKFGCSASSYEIPVFVRTIKLNASGKGTATYTNPDVGAFKIAITVTSTGKASGSVKPTGLCQTESTARFTAKRL
jgi:hypothetical protein